MDVEKDGLVPRKEMNHMEEMKRQDAGRTCFLPMDRIVPRQDGPMTRAERSALRELADSIREDGLIRPITVEPLPDGRYGVVSGNRRLQACRMCGMTHIDAVVTSAEELPGGAKRLLERIRRGGLHCTEEAELLQTLHSRLGVSVHGLAEALRCAPEDIERRLSLMQLSAPVRQVLRERNAPERAAVALLRVPDEHARLRIARQVNREELGVRDVALLADSAARRQDGTEQPEPPAASRCADGPHGARVVVRDSRLYLNAIRSIVAQMQEAGMPAELQERGGGDGLEMVVRLTQPRRRMLRCHASSSAQAR